MDKERTKINLQDKHSYPAGDFRSRECIELLKEADIIVTNPPFSLWREFLAQLVEYKKKFLIIGNMACVSYKEVFPLLKGNKMWIGVSRKSVSCKTSFSSVPKTFGNIRWFTNLKANYKVKPLDLSKNHYTTEKYPKYDNYYAINVDKVADIPCDYPGVMGVPLTFFDKYCPEQFEIKDANDFRLNNTVPIKSHGLIKDKHGTVDGKAKYARVLLKNKHPEWSKHRLCTGCIPGLIAYSERIEGKGRREKIENYMQKHSNDQNAGLKPA